MQFEELACTIYQNTTGMLPSCYLLSLWLLTNNHSVREEDETDYPSAVSLGAASLGWMCEVRDHAMCAVAKYLEQ